MTFGAFSNTYHRYLSEDSVRTLLADSVHRPDSRAALIRHLKNGFFSYRVEPYGDHRLLGRIVFLNRGLVECVLNPDVTQAALSGLISGFTPALINTVLHQPYEEFTGLLQPYEHPMTILQLRAHTSPLRGWTDHLRDVYRDQPFYSQARKTTISIALDLLRLIQATQENVILKDEADPFARAGTINQDALLETLHNALISLSQEGVITYEIPRHANWKKLLTRPDLAAACEPSGYILPLAGIEALESIMLEGGQPMPDSMLISPDPDALLSALTDSALQYSWAAFILASGHHQAYLVRSPIIPGQFSVFVVHIEQNHIQYAGEIPPASPSLSAERLSIIVDHTVAKMNGSHGSPSSVPPTRVQHI